MTDSSRAQLLKASRRWVEAAGALLRMNGGRPRETAYLVHVGVECALKARILVRARATSVTDLRRLLPEDDWNELFRGSSGHDLGALAKKACLKMLLVNEDRESLLSAAAWARMTSADRPYSLRYGAIVVPLRDATEELEVGGTIVRMVEERA